MTWDWAISNLARITLIASPAVTLTMWGVRATYPTKAAVGRAIARQAEAGAAEIKVMDERLGQVESRVLKIEGNMGSLATREDVGRVLIALAAQDGERKALEAKVDGIGRELKAIARPLDLIQEHLLNRERD